GAPVQNDLNSLVRSGLYQFSGPTSGAPPFNYGVIFVLPRAGGEVVQVAWDILTGAQVQRRFYSGVWSEWFVLFHTGNFDPNSKLNADEAGFTIIYPNGGSAASPANVAV